MPRAESSLILQWIRQVAQDPAVRQQSDQQLLRQFRDHQDETAFGTLLRRHGPMVLDVCRGVLGNEADVEDAFQATFLVLARKAASIRKTVSVGSWLHGVAYRTALKAQAAAVRRRKNQARAPARPGSESDDLTWREVRQVLHQELAGLAERYRVPLVACYLEGKTQDEAAAQLGMAKSTLKERLERGRGLLRARLVRRGLGPAAVLLAATWPGAAASACLPATLVTSTIRAAKLGARTISPRIAALAEGVLKTMVWAKLKTGTAVLMAVAIGLAGGVACWQSFASAGESGGETTSATFAEEGPKPATDNLAETLLALNKHFWDIIARGDGKELAKFLADDFVSISVLGRFGKSDFVTACPRLRLADARFTDPLVIRVSKDAAILTYLYSCKILSAADGRLIETREDCRLTFAWANRNGGWVIVYCQHNHSLQARGAVHLDGVVDNIRWDPAPKPPAEKPASVQAGQEAPPIIALHPDGNAMLPERPKEKYVLLVFWSLQDRKGAQPLEELKRSRKEFAGDDRFRIVSVCTDAWDENQDVWEAWSKYLLDQGTVDFGNGPTRFIDDPRWWNVFQNPHVENPSSRRYGVTKLPAAFLIGPDGKLLAVHIPSKDLQTTVRAALRPQP
jgi:RNA polymerase sigma factor (sigma-70 family)